MGVFNQENNYFGLDIGTTAIRLVQLRGSGGKAILVNYGSAPVPVGLVASDSKIDQDKMSEIIKRLVADSGITTKNVVVGLPSASFFAAIITTPKLTNAELAKAIKFQADQYIPMALDQVKLDWAVVADGPTEHEQEVLLVAAPNTVVAKYMEVTQKAGLEVLALEANAIALARALVSPSAGAAMILDMGAFSTGLSIVHNGSPLLIRSVAVGGGTLIKAVGQSLNLDDSKAEQFAYRFGLTQAKLEGQVLAAIKPVLDTVIAEVQKSNKFFLGRYPNFKLEKLILSGGTAALPELATYMANALGLPVEMGNAWLNVSYPANLQEKLFSVANQFGVATGLAERMFV